MQRIPRLLLCLALPLMLNACARPTPVAGTAPPQTEASRTGELRIETVASGLEHPWAVALLPDGGFLVTERPGRLRRIYADGAVSAPLAGVPAVFAEGQGGLLDVVLDPGFAGNRRIWLSYAEPGPDDTAGTAVATATLGDAALSDLRVIYRQTPKLKGPNHFGSRIAFDGRGHVFISQGERNQKELAQDLEVLQGKLVRLKLDGGIPADNPFADGVGVRRTIWSYGHRNMQGMAVDPRSGRLWQSEHGPRGGDEINLPQPGRNYGWPVITYGKEYSGATIGRGLRTQAGMEQPLYYWDPSIAPSGMAFVSSERYPGWKGDLMVAALKFQYLARLQLKDGKVVAEHKLLPDVGQRLRDVRQGPDGWLYLVTDSSEGRLLRVKPR